MKLAPEYGVLRVESEPARAQIEINGEPTIQLTPFTFPKKRAGSYRVTVSKRGYVPRTERVTLGHGNKALIRAKLQPDYGSLTVRSVPSGVPVYVEGRDTGKRTPAVLKRVRSGLRTIGLWSDAHVVTWRRIKIERGKSHELDVEMTPRTGTLEVLASGLPHVEVQADVSKAPVPPAGPRVSATHLAGARDGPLPKIDRYAGEVVPPHPLKLTALRVEPLVTRTRAGEWLAWLGTMSMGGGSAALLLSSTSLQELPYEFGG